MVDFLIPIPTIAVFPVLVGPLQTLLALLPAILAGTASLLLAALKPAGFVKLVKFCWRQKLVLGIIAGLIWIWQSGSLASFLHRNGPARGAVEGI